LHKRGIAIVLVCLIVSAPLPVAASETEAFDVDTTEPVVLSENPEYFRVQLLDFVRDMDDALQVALQHPLIGPQLAVSIEEGLVRIPLPPETYTIIEDAPLEELDGLRSAMAAAPGALNAPELLRFGLANLPTTPRAMQAGCTDVYGDFATVVSLTEAQRGVTIANNVVGLLVGVFKLLKDAFNTGVTCETPIDIPTSWYQIPGIIILGVAELVSLALDLTVDELGFSIVDADRCINLTTCPPHGFTERFRQEEAPTRLGKGCDNRDNNCVGGIDETSEDLFSPAVAIDAALTSRCYTSETVANAAAMLAVRAEDDCVSLSENPSPHEGQLEVQFTRSNCVGTLMATATDIKGNTEAANAIFTIDDAPPVIALQDLSGTCQPTVEAARTAFGLMATDDCTGARTKVAVVEKECVADFEFEAIDGCGNRTTARQSVRLDGAAPAVDIDRLLLPAVDGRICFGNEPSAVTEVAEATHFLDNCATPDLLDFVTTATPTGSNSCDREIRSTVTDNCGLVNSDSLQVRLDDAPPTLSCSVATPILDPPDGQWVDVGFVLNVDDDCGAADVKIDVAVTSDEPTSFQLDVKGEEDLAPDARIEFGPGDVPIVFLRAERQQTTSADGRVYLIRSTATDACGNQSHTDCYVVVPKVQTNNRSDVVNSGQIFDATARN
jgi:hypothetical protein